MNGRTLNCPNCGYPIQTAQCPCCGTVFYDFVNIGFEQDAFIRLNIGGNLLIFRASVEHVSLSEDDRDLEGTTLYSDNMPFITIKKAPIATLDVKFRLVCDDDDKLLSIIKKKEE